MFLFTIITLFYEFFLLDKSESLHCLRKARGEYKNKDRLSNNIFLDALLSMAKFQESKEDYVHEISLNPFGFSLISEKQVNK